MNSIAILLYAVHLTCIISYVKHCQLVREKKPAFTWLGISEDSLGFNEQSSQASQFSLNNILVYAGLLHTFL